MDYFLRIDIILFALCLLIILFYSVMRHSEKHLIHTKLYLALICINGVLLILDLVLWSIEGRVSPLLLHLNQSFNLMALAIDPLAAIVWLLYVDYQIFSDEDRLKSRIPYYLIPFLVNGALLVWSAFSGFIFFIDTYNIYHRGPGYGVFLVINFGTLFYTCLLSFRNRKHVDTRTLLTLQFYVFPILLGSILQSFYYGLVLSWPSLTLSIFIVFITIEMRKLYRDYLTGAHSRRQLDQYMHYRIRQTQKGKGFAIAMIDLDDFKDINDSLGHHVGDEALVQTVRMINHSVRCKDFVARFAGDEFVIVFDIDDEYALQEILNRLHKNMLHFNQSNLSCYQLNYSIGTEIVKGFQPCNYNELLKSIDAKMYKSKKNKKRDSLACTTSSLISIPS